MNKNKKYTIILLLLYDVRRTQHRGRVRRVLPRKDIIFVKDRRRRAAYRNRIDSAIESDDYNPKTRASDRYAWFLSKIKKTMRFLILLLLCCKNRSLGAETR